MNTIPVGTRVRVKRASGEEFTGTVVAGWLDDHDGDAYEVRRDDRSMADVWPFRDEDEIEPLDAHP